MVKVLAGEKLLFTAHEIAKKAHKGEIYGTEPYVWHSVGVAHLIERMGYPPEIIGAGLLHDVVSASAVTLEDLRKERFPEPTVVAVDDVTFVDEIDNPHGLTNRDLYDLKLQKACRTIGGHVVKYCDSAKIYSDAVAGFSEGYKGDELAAIMGHRASYIADLYNGLPTDDVAEEYILEYFTDVSKQTEVIRDDFDAPGTKPIERTYLRQAYWEQAEAKHLKRQRKASKGRAITVLSELAKTSDY